MDNSNMFTVTPMSQSTELNAGDIYEGDIIVANPANAKGDFHYKVEVSPYAVSGEDYVADFSHELTESERSQIVNWTTIENPTGVLKPNESAKVHYKVVVPENAPAGGQYAALLVSSDDNASSSDGVAVNNVFEMASILYAKINGDLIHKGELLGSKVPGFVTSLPLTVEASFKNDGNIHEVAYISLEVRSYFSSENIYPKKDESGTVQEVIMPGTTRYVTRDIEGISPLGIYDVIETVSYMGESVTNHQMVIVCPIWFMALVAVTIAAIIVFIIHSIKKHRTNKQVV